MWRLAHADLQRIMGKCFQGSMVMGMGFVLGAEKKQRLIDQRLCKQSRCDVSLSLTVRTSTHARPITEPMGHQLL